MFWIFIALLTAAVAIVLTYPLMRSSGVADTAREGEVAVYRDQLAELQRERESGLIGETEAEYARAEIGRRLLAAASGKTGEVAAISPRKHNALASIVTVLLPLTGLCLYLFMGSPGMPDMPLQARLEKPGNDMDLMIAKAERHLAQNPDDGAGWDVLAPIYFKTMRLGDAEMAYRNAIRLQGENPERLTGLAETLIATNDGVVIDDARSALEDAEKMSPGNPRVRFYLALSLEQAGKTDEARNAFAALLKDSPEGAPWIPLLQAHLQNTGGADIAAAPKPQAPGGPSAEDVAAASNMSAEDRQAMVAGMVESLDARLKENPDNFEGWMRLVRSYAMLKNDEKARQALADGLKAFPPDGEQGKQLMALAQQLGVSAQGVTQ
ncbi:c-type cytochrome biogenesis protein CcmI [Agrobacterium rosae]|uniref:C-type cytochrome biogenesis protein CcmI n=1 Tax=Agrobacterium rosae TaxID=1972867 RepID=A0AAE5VPR7_9HYPH|nr:c-type cytochrome biogenesis protein CcmI [Agrobacterium rosae]KAA3514420.1 c-type cytochrome biogenesis protein CcmI [Agrobacterium rosae]KAA3523085.1 c-type cytochrome biogenesis protein CcmI [Agrobacterium rosae]MCM2433605.1 c-type cytochrome biogenesis protein CcmI [Agrobacterium rosae]MDX8329841.1 c-type cytochrome biogenesis protein CcmI [Agrobacterium rosae]MQB47803.1 c-type cytochrome biogenesis protein CcmI [Agrobacterium rosae]